MMPASRPGGKRDRTGRGYSSIRIARAAAAFGLSISRCSAAFVVSMMRCASRLAASTRLSFSALNHPPLKG